MPAVLESVAFAEMSEAALAESQAAVEQEQVNQQFEAMIAEIDGVPAEVKERAAHEAGFKALTNIPDGGNWYCPS